MKSYQHIRNAISSNFNDENPILLFPVRIETKFKESLVADQIFEVQEDYNFSDFFTEVLDAVEEAQYKANQIFEQPEGYLLNPSMVKQELFPLFSEAQTQMAKVGHLVLAEQNKIQYEFRKLASRIDQFEALLQKEEKTFSNKIRINQGNIENCEKWLDRFLILSSEIANSVVARNEEGRNDKELLGQREALLEAINLELQKTEAKSATKDISFFDINEAFDSVNDSIEAITTISASEAEMFQNNVSEIVDLTQVFINQFQELSNNEKDVFINQLGIYNENLELVKKMNDQFLEFSSQLRNKVKNRSESQEESFFAQLELVLKNIDSETQKITNDGGLVEVSFDSIVEGYDTVIRSIEAIEVINKGDEERLARIEKNINNSAISFIDQFQSFLSKEEGIFNDQFGSNQQNIDSINQSNVLLSSLSSEKINNTSKGSAKGQGELFTHYDLVLETINSEFQKLNGESGDAEVSFSVIQEAYEIGVESLSGFDEIGAGDVETLRQKENEIVDAALAFSNNMTEFQSVLSTKKEAMIIIHGELVEKTAELEDQIINGEYAVVQPEPDQMPDEFRPAFIVKFEDRWTVSRSLVHELLVRVYPDVAAIRTQEQNLTNDEILYAKSYWKNTWEYIDDEEKLKGFWRGIVNSFGSNRAAWIVKQLTPSNMMDRPLNVSLSAVELSAIGTLDFNISPQLSYIALAKAYWDQIWTANGDISTETSAWNSLSSIPTSIGAQAVGEKLKYALIKACKPMNWDYFNSTNFDSAILPEYPVDSEIISLITELTIYSILIGSYLSPSFPTVSTKPHSWSAASITDVMPDNFVFNLFNHDGTVNKFVGNTLDPIIITGLDPDFDDTNPSFTRDSITGKITTGDDIKWMTDFNEAVTKGLGIRIHLTSEQATSGIDKLIVLGAKTSKNDLEGKALIEQLFEDHHFSEDGFELFPQGAPTNNTEEKDSGYSSKDVGSDEGYERERKGPQFTLETDDIDKKDGQWFAEALGIDPDIMQHVKNSGGEDIISAMHMNQALFQGTLGLFMQVMLKELFFDATKDTSGINSLREFIIKYISARGFIPAVRIGKQPYGVLATTAYSKWSSSETISMANSVSFYTDKFDAIWQQIVDEDKVAYIDKTTGTEELAQENFLQVLGLNPSSVAYYVRYGLSSGPAAKLPLMLQEVVQVNNYWDGLKNLMQNVDSVLDRSKSLLFKTVFNGGAITGFGNEATHILEPRAENQTPGGGVVDVNPLSRNRGVKDYSDTESRNYIEMLLDKSPENYLQRLRAQLFEDTPDEDNRPNSLLFLHLWQGLTMQYFDSSMDVLDAIKNVTLNVLQIIPLSSYAASQFSNSETSPYALIKLGAPINKRVLEHGATIHVSGMSNSNLNGVYPIIGADEFKNSQILPAPDTIIVGNNLTATTPSLPTSPVNGGYTQVEYAFKTNGIGIVFPKIGLVVRKNNGFLAHTDLTNYQGGAITGGQIIGPWKYMLNDENGYADFAGTKSVAQYLVDHLDTTVYTEESKFLKEVLRALEFLKDKSTDQLEMCFAEHLDLLSYRLDAWKQGAVNERLRDLRKANPNSGTYIGAYGWVENLRPKTRTVVPSNSLPDGYTTSDKLTLDEANQGFVHAPSIPHASTAAILRSAYFADADQNNPDQMAVNLSSKRVRRALWYMEGVRNGQLLAALLGYQLERHLHEENISANAYITEIRAEYPLVSQSADNAGGVSVETVEARNVINGAELIRIITEDSIGYPYNVTSLPSSGPEKIAIENGINRILDDMDAISDLGLSEGVFHIAQGNYERGKAVLDAVSTGGRPPEFDVVKTPRSGYTLTNKVGVLFDETASPGSSSRSIADPYLNKWLGDLLGSMNNIRCRVHFIDTSDAAQIGEINVAQLALEPIDLIFILKDTPQDDAADLAVLIRNYAIQNFTNVQPETIELKFEEIDNAWGMEVKTFMEISYLAEKIEDMIGASRPIFDEDFIPPSVNSAVINNPRGIDISDYLNRCRLALGVDAGGTITGGLAQVAFDISDIDTNGALYPDDASKIVAYTSALQTCFQYGIAGTIAPIPTGIDVDDVVELKVKAEGILGSLSNLVVQATSILTFDSALPINKQYDLVLEAFQTIYGRSFKPAPRFNFSDPTQIVAASANSRSESIMAYITSEQDYDVTEYAVSVEDWLFGMSKVKDKIRREESIRTILANFDSEIEYTPLQFPIETDITAPEHWLATEYPETYGVDKDTSCLALQIYTAAADFSGLQMGLIFDEWNEVIPVKEETTGIAFHYDQPNAKAPNAMLLAVSPVLNGNWTFDNLLDTVVETYSTMKKRAVEPDHLEKTPLAHILPAAMSWVSNDPRLINMDPGANINKLFPGTNIPYIETSNSAGGLDSKTGTVIGDLLDYEYKFNNNDPSSTSAIAYPAS